MPYVVTSNELAKFQQSLIGTWQTATDLNEGDKPLSFNVMPLPQVPPPAGRSNAYGGFILKNFAFAETLRFNGTAGKADPPDQQDPGAVAVTAGAPNRSGEYSQIAHALFYEQQVRFVEGPDNGKIVHVENGAWLHLGSAQQVSGPYGPTNVSGQVLPQPPYLTIAKQIAVPHGNSVLALGNIDLNAQASFSKDLSGLQTQTVFLGAPTIPDAFAPYPQPPDISTAPLPDPYATLTTGQNNADYENPNVAWTLNPNQPLQIAVGKIEPTAFMHWRVTTLPLFGGDGVVTNIPFEDRRAKVTDYWADYWLLSKDATASEGGTFDYLLYTQTVLMEMLIERGGSSSAYVFPHVTSSVLKKVDGTPTDARKSGQTQPE